MPALGFARVHVGEMHFDEGQLDRGERVANRETGMRVRAGIDHDAGNASPQCVNCIDQLPLAVVLREFQLRAELFRYAPQRTLNVGERLAAVQSRLASAEEIQVRTIEDRDLHVFFSPFNQLLNCAMSSLPRCAAADVGSLGFAAESFMSSAKN